MAGINNITVFNSWVYRTISEVVAQQLDLFNAATRGAIILRNHPNIGDFSDKSMWKLLSGAVRRRNVYGTGAVTPIDLTMLIESMVKVAGGTPPINIPPNMFVWILKSPDEAGAVIGQQLAELMVQDMLNTAIAAVVAALAGQAANLLDVSGGTGGAELFSPSSLNLGKAKLGDASAEVVAWVVHSKPMHDYFANAITNAANLFTYGTVNVVASPFGEPLIMSDVPALVVAGSPTDYYSLGLVPGAVLVERNEDFIDNLDTVNGDENIGRTYQAEWSYNLGLKGMTWDKTNGGKSPSAAALATSTNWDKVATSHKDLPGVALRTQ